METERRGYMVIAGEGVEDSNEIGNFYKALLCAGATINLKHLEKVNGSDTLFRVTNEGIEYARRRRNRFFADTPEEPVKESHEVVGFGD